MDIGNDSAHQPNSTYNEYGCKERQGLQVDFDIHSVQVKEKGDKGKAILQDVKGTACKGEVLSIMGPSGAGKSTLLDLLAGVHNKRKLKTKGIVTMDGAPASKISAKRICYVRQVDVLVPTATVREALTTSAFLKLPLSMPKDQKYALVDNIIDELGLRQCENILVGDDTLGIKGISGGQMRRTTVGVELVKNPSVIFLDEPTSGLDSEIALGIAEMLRKLSRSGRTVVMTIHQPNSDIVDTFDRFLLLAGGRICYHGAYNMCTSAFAMAGFPCPTYKNPTDHFMRIVSNPVDAAQVIASFASNISSNSGEVAHIPPIAEPELHDCSQITVTIVEELPAHSSTGDVSKTAPPEEYADDENGINDDFNDMAIVDSKGLYSTPPAWFQFAVLIKRFSKSMIRDPIAFSGELVQYAFMAVFMALVYLQITNELPAALSDRAASQWFGLVLVGFVPCFTATTAWVSERRVLRRETADNTYKVTVFYMAKILSVMPFEILFGLMYSLIVYWAVGYQPGFVHFLIYTITNILVLLISQAYGLMAAAITNDANSALILVSLVLIVLLAFTGFLTARVPVYFAWVKWISYLNYSSSILWVNEIRGLTLYDSGGQEVDAGQAAAESQFNNLDNGLGISTNLGILIANLVIVHAISLSAISYVKWRRVL